MHQEHADKVGHEEHYDIKGQDPDSRQGVVRLFSEEEVTDFPK